jgi:PBSX family phage terminase large subunit
MSISKTAAKRELWRRGLLQYKMHSNQLEMYNIYKTSSDNSIMVWLLARQSGKSFALDLIAVMECLAKPNVIVKLLTDTKLHAKTIHEPIFRQIFEDCPEDLKPEYIPSQYVYIFKNGSQIQLAGSDGNSAERLRGQKSDLVLVDEAGFCSNLEYNVMSILLPTTTHTGGKIILASTPPEDPAHDFIQFIERAEKDNLLTTKTVYDNPLLTTEQISSIVSKFTGGVNNTQFRREYLCEIVKDEQLSVLPEVDDELLAEITKVYDNPPFANRYVAMDIGFRDLTVVLYGYYDFRNDLIIIEDEIAVRGKDIHLPVFTEDLLKKEEELWTNPLTNELFQPDLRVSDINPFVIQEISRASNGKLAFSTASKDNKLANINKLRVMLANKKIFINPKCKTLLRHLKNARWKDKTSKDDFARSPDDGHYDAIDALLYFVRAINYNKNPYPAGYGHNIRNMHIENRQKFMGQQSQLVYEAIFGTKKRK